MDFKIAGKVALVCGAGSGLGRAIAQSLAAEGVLVAVTGRTPQKLAETVGLIEQAGGRARAWVLDLTRPETFDEVLTDIRRTLGPVGILVNNSGGPAPSAASGVALARWQQEFTAMAGSLIHLTDCVLPDMRAAGWGRIITSSSSGVVTPIANLAVSNTLRMALSGWSKTLAGEVAASGITVNVLVPGRIATARVDQLDAARAEREGVTAAAVKEKSQAAIPVGRYGDPAEYGVAAVFLASRQAAFITGAILRVDGGMSPCL
ncbi:3-oxoacyl-ACP reductase [Brenneria goodwinii]|uniref:3-oxoacyl-ACP reductase n=1 Tax=Brenneria goodwinii TaxID=1109412 RepID=A0AAE8JMB6_9GAMM|nr:SDR family oxidoreductase [Brenneria goodwinii]ATA23732.1 3-oxoacyl-ACP reductase [Brenneria goodwinii]RLM20841.1 3-oxoacyl-ACP reductase [Brenneria goodwinii]